MPTPIRRRVRLAQRAAVYGVAIVLVCMAVVLGVASQVLPLVERNPQRVATWLSERAGRPVHFDHVTTQWTRRGPLLQLDGLRIGDARDGVRVGQAEVLVSMYGGLLPGRSFTELRLRGLALTVQRADDGTWSVRGLPGQQAGGDPLASLEGLGELQVINGVLDLDAPSLGWKLRVPDVDLRLRVDGDRVRAGVRAHIRPDAAPLQMTIDFDRQHGDGRAYAEMIADDLAAWSPLLRFGGVALESGRGRLQAWASLHRHRVVMMTTEAHLRSLGLHGAPASANAAPPRVAFGQVDGRVRWRLARGGWRFDAPQLSVGTGTSRQTLDGLVLAGGERYALLARELDGAPLFAVLGLSDRIDPGPRRWLQQARPNARLADVEIVGARGGAMHAQGRLVGVGFASVGGSPGLNGLSGRFIGDADGVRLRLDPGARLRFDWPSGFGVVHDVQLQGDLVGWREGAGWRVGTAALHVRGRDYGARVRGGMWFQNDGTRPWIDLAADIEEAPVPAAKGFWIHNKMPRAAVDWLNSALVDGRVQNGRAVVSGDLDDWPFEHQNGRFEAVAHIARGQFKFQPDWPALQNVDADIAFIGNGFSLEGRGDLAGVAIKSFRAGIEDFGDSNLRVDAQTDTDAGTLLSMLRQSPLQKSYGDTLTHLEAAGRTHATFHLLQPLKHDSPTRRELNGEVQLASARLAEKRWNLAFSEVTGKAAYNGEGFVAENLSVVHQTQPGVLSLRAGGGTRDQKQAFEADLTAKLDARELLDRAPEVAWLKPYIEGRSDWTVGVSIPRGANATTQLQLRSSLVGTALTLPAPLDKPSFASLPTTVKTTLPLGNGQIDVAFGQRLALRARSQGDLIGVRVALGTDTVTEAPPASGLIATGRARSLAAMDWIAIARGGGGDGKLPLRHIDVTADRLLLLGAAFPNTRVQLAPAANATAITLEGNALAGGLMVPDAKGAPIAGKLSRLYWRSATPRAGATQTSTRTPSVPPLRTGPVPPIAATANAMSPTEEPINPANIPPLQLDVDDFRFGDATLGSARLRTRALPAGLQIDQLQVRSPDQNIDVTGTWLGVGERARTRLDARIDSRDFGKLTDSFGYAGRVGGGHGTLHLDAGWPGTPADFNISAIEGHVTIDARDGHLLELEPGAGRVLGLLSVAELRRRLMLDFSDFFDKGFAFNRMQGSVALGGGTATTESLVIDGPAAEIRVRGDTDLRAQRFDQTVDVLPKSANVLTAVGAVAGGPIGAAVGAVANAVLRKPLSEMGAKTYRVTGPWKDPKVEVVSRQESRADRPNDAPAESR